MPGVLLPNGGRLFGEGLVDPGICGPTGTGVLLPNGGRLYGAEPCGEVPPIPPVLADAVLLLRSSAVGSGYVDGDLWLNEGTGSGLDAVPTTPEGYTGTFPDGTAGFRTAPAYFGPGDGLPTRRFFSAATDEGDGANSSQLVTPHTAAMEFTDGWFMACQAESIADATSHGAVQSVRVRVCVDATEFVGNDLCVNVDTGQIRVTAPTGGPQDLGDPGVVDAYEVTEIAGSIIAATGLYRAYVRDDADPDVTVGGRGWRIVGETTEGAVALGDTEGPLIVGIGKGWYGWAEVYEFDGTDATLVAACDPSDAAAWAGPGDTFTTGGTEWTLGANSAIVDAARAGFMGGIAGTQFAVPSSSLLTPGTADFTVAAHVAVPQVDTTFTTLRSRYTGTPGVDANGWGIIDAAAVPPGGLGAFMSPTLAVATDSWATGEHLIVLRRTGDDAELWLDGVLHLTLDVTGRDLDADAALGLLQDTVHAAFDYADWDRALTTTEITVDLPLAFP